LGVELARVHEVELADVKRSSVLRGAHALPAIDFDALERIRENVLDHLHLAVANQGRQEADTILYGAVGRPTFDERIPVVACVLAVDGLHRQRAMQLVELKYGVLHGADGARPGLLALPILEEVQEGQLDATSMRTRRDCRLVRRRPRARLRRHRYDGRRRRRLRDHQTAEPVEGGLDGPQNLQVPKRRGSRVITSL